MLKTLKYFWLLLLLGICQSAALAQVLTVKDQTERQPLELVTVFSNNPAASAITDARGRADISAFVGSDSIFIRFIGFESEVYSFEELKAANFNIYLKETLFPLNEIVVSAVGWEQYKRETPHSIVTIEPSEVVLQNPQTAADLLGLSGQVYIQKSQMGGGSPMIRGFAANRVLIAIDGVRMNNAIFRSGNLHNVISLDPFSVDNTEVIFGSGSVIYGSDAIGGVMSFQTLQPKMSKNDQLLAVGSATTRWSSANGEKTGHVHTNLGWEKWALVSSFTYTDYGDLKMGRHGPDEYLRPEYVETNNGNDRLVTNRDPLLQTPTGFRQINLLQKLRFMPNDHWDFNYGVHYSTTSDHPRYDRLLRYRGGQLRSAEWYYGPQVWLMNNLNLTYSAGNAFFDKMAATLAHQQFEESRHDRDFGRTIRSNRQEKVRVFSANLDFEKNTGDEHQLYYGLEVLLNKVGSTGTDEDVESGVLTPGPSRYPDGATWHSMAAYLNYRWKPRSSLVLQVGLRYNHILLDAVFDKTFYAFPFSEASISTGSLTGSGGVVWSSSDDLRLFLNLSTGFRAPNIDDIGKVFDSEPGAVVIPNPDLKPEYAWNGELGLSKIFGNKLKLDLATYYTHLANALVRRDYTLNGLDQIMYEGEWSQVQAIQNAAYARVFGIQAALEVKLLSDLSLLSRFNYQKGEEELDDGTTGPLRHAPPWFGVTHLIWKRHRLRMDLYTVYNGEMSNEDLAPGEQRKDYIYAIDENGLPYSPAWYTLNIKAMYQLWDTLSLNVGLENLTNQRYRPYSSGLVAPGRNLILSLKVGF